MGGPGFWDDQQRAAEISTEHSRVTKRLERFRRLDQEYRDARELAEMDGEMADEIAASLRPLHAELARLEEDALFNGEYDGGDAVVTIHAGAGGTDSQDWAEILLRMYLRWAEGRGFQTETTRGQPRRGGRAQVGDVHCARRERLWGLQGRARRSPARASVALRLGASASYVVRAGDRQSAPA